MMKKDGEAIQERRLLDSYSDFTDEELIEDWLLDCEPPATDPRYWAIALVYIERRHVIYLRGLEDREEVKKADRWLIEATLKEGADPVYSPYEDQDPEAYPLKFWWWHLHKIGEKTYPPELLPEHLREIYLKAF